jgi:hypothetical protein
MDGSAGVAQCPVPPNSSFTYDFPVRCVASDGVPLLTISLGQPSRDILVSFTHSRSIPRWPSGAPDRPRPELPLPLR